MLASFVVGEGVRGEEGGEGSVVLLAMCICLVVIVCACKVQMRVCCLSVSVRACVWV